MGRIIEFPENWEELKSHQAQQVFELHMDHVKGDISERDLKLMLISDWLNLGFAFNYRKTKYTKTKRSNEVEHMHAQLYRIMETMGWLYKSEEIEKTVKKKKRKVILKTLAYDSRHNYFPKVETDSYTFVPPEPFYSIRAGQFVAAFGHSVKYYQSKNTDDLDRFFATLYLPERKRITSLKSDPAWDGQQQEKYNEKLTDYYVDVLKDVSPGIKYGTLLWFMNWDRYLKTSEIEVEGRQIKLNALFKSGTGGESLGLTGLLLNIAEEGAFGTIDEVMERPLIDIYIKMYNNYLAIKNMKRK